MHTTTTEYSVPNDEYFSRIKGILYQYSMFYSNLEISKTPEPVLNQSVYSTRPTRAQLPKSTIKAFGRRDRNVSIPQGRAGNRKGILYNELQ